MLINKKTKLIILFSIWKNEIIGIKDIVIKEEIDDVLKIKVIKTHNKTKEIPIFKDTAKQMPKYVAIPLPPLNFNQTGKLWPRKEKRPANAIR